MRALVQRVSEAAVAVDGKVVGSIERGLMILLGVRHGDGQADAEWVARKCANLRIFEDDEGTLNLSALDVGAAALVVSQFTLYADIRKGRRPSFIEAAPPQISEPIYEHFVAALRGEGMDVATGVFGARMAVHLVNDGPVTVMVDKEQE